MHSMARHDVGRESSSARKQQSIDTIRSAVCELIAAGDDPTNAKVVRATGISERTVKTYRADIQAELNTSLQEAFAALLRIPVRSRDPDFVRAYEMLGFTIPAPEPESPRPSLFKRDCPFALLRVMPTADARALLEQASSRFGQIMNPEVDVADAVADLEQAFGHEESVMNAIACELVILVEEHVRKKSVKPPILNPNSRRRSAA